MKNPNTDYGNKKPLEDISFKLFLVLAAFVWSLAVIVGLAI